MATVKACAFCGEPFVAEDDDLVYCCFDCYLKHKRQKKGLRSKTEVEKLNYERRVQADKDHTASERRRAWLARRDAEYAANAPRVKSVERGGVLVETRGFCPCASTLGIRHQSVTDKGVVYIV